jgi:hypothetical protein
MRYLLTTAAAVALTLGLGFEAKAQDGPEVRLVQNWYFRYLQRPADAVGLDGWVCQLRRGTPAECVEAQILASDEYYCLHGRTAEGFIAGLYGDVLGRAPAPCDVRHWEDQLCRNGRVEMTKQFLCDARRELAGPAVPVYVPAAAPVLVPVAPPPVVVAPARVSVRIRYVRP